MMEYGHWVEGDMPWGQALSGNQSKNLVLALLAMGPIRPDPDAGAGGKEKTGAQNMKGAMPSPCILVIQLIAQNGRERFNLN
jgi:hypothetical protein